MVTEVDHSIFQRLLDAGFRYVSIRKRSEKEIRDFLKKKASRIVGGIAILDEVIEKLREYGYVNDQAFALWVTSSRISHNPHGTSSIVHELKGKGVSDEIITEVLRIQSDDTKSDKELAIQVAIKVIGRYAALPKIERKRKLFGVLGRRGFSFSVISSVVDDLV
jgi:regulatory protein